MDKTKQEAERAAFNEWFDKGGHNGSAWEVWQAARATPSTAPASAAPSGAGWLEGGWITPLNARKLANLTERGWLPVGTILFNDGDFALFDSSCRWLTTAQYQRLMHEQDGSLFAQPESAQQAGDALDAARWRLFIDSQVEARGKEWADQVTKEIDMANAILAASAKEM